jgi:hypothetical protein
MHLDFHFLSPSPFLQADHCLIVNVKEIFTVIDYFPHFRYLNIVVAILGAPSRLGFPTWLFSFLFSVLGGHHYKEIAEKASHARNRMLAR